MPIDSSWKSMYNSIIKKHGPKKGKQIYYAKLNKHKLDDTKPMPKHLPKEFFEDLFEMMLIIPDKLKGSEEEDDDEEDDDLPLTFNGHDRFMREFTRSMKYWSTKRLQPGYQEP